MLSMCASSSAPIVAQIETTRKPTEPIIVVISISPLSRQNVKIPQKIAQIVEITDLKIDFFIFFFSFPLLCLYYSMELVVCQVFFPFLIVKFLTSAPGLCELFNKQRHENSLENYSRLFIISQISGWVSSSFSSTWTESCA